MMTRELSKMNIDMKMIFILTKIHKKGIALSLVL